MSIIFLISFPVSFCFQIFLIPLAATSGLKELGAKLNGIADEVSVTDEVAQVNRVVQVEREESAAQVA